MPSYTDEEKITIARQYVLPALMNEAGLTDQNLSIDEAVWPKLVRPLGYDAGIRSLERRLNNLCRKVARMVVEGRVQSVRVDEQNAKEFMELY